MVDPNSPDKFVRRVEHLTFFVFFCAFLFMSFTLPSQGLNYFGDSTRQTCSVVAELWPKLASEMRYLEFNDEQFLVPHCVARISFPLITLVIVTSGLLASLGRVGEFEARGAIWKLGSLPFLALVFFAFFYSFFVRVSDLENNRIAAKLLGRVVAYAWMPMIHTALVALLLRVAIVLVLNSRGGNR